MNRLSVMAVLGLIACLSAVTEPRVFSTREFFYIGGKYTGPSASEVMSGQMYVEVLRPERVTRKYPLLFLHGLSQTATNWLGTPEVSAALQKWIAGHVQHAAGEFSLPR